MEGRLEICIGGVWGTVCDDQFDNIAARVVCSQLNYSRAGLSTIQSIVFCCSNLYLPIGRTILCVLILKKLWCISFKNLQ